MQTPQADSTRTAAASPPRWRDWLPAAQAIDRRERLRVIVGVLLGIMWTALLAHAVVPPGGSWLLAPIGASAVLVFAAPSSPFAHPWAVVGGNVLSTLAGIACMHWLGEGPATAAIAVALAIAVMLTARCLHPPGGACALLVVLGGVLPLEFALPVLLDSLLLVAAGMAYNSATGRLYPPRPAPAPIAQISRRSFTDADLDAVLTRYNQVLDVSREDLVDLMEQAQVQAWRRRSGQLRCRDVMSPAPVAVSYATPLPEAWSLLRRHGVKSLPVVDTANRIAGIVTLADFIREAGVDSQPRWTERLRKWLLPSPEKNETVGEIMTRQVRVVSAERPIGELLPLFAGTGHHHVPVIDGDQQLVGIITQSDLVRALARLD